MTRFYFLALLGFMSFGHHALAEDYIPYSVIAESHPYRYLPPYGHASQNPGSPRYFEPGYGYRIPGFGFRGQTTSVLPRYGTYYQFGRRVPGLYSDDRQRYWMNSYGGPWYLPGSQSNTQTRWPSW